MSGGASTNGPDLAPVGSPKNIVYQYQLAKEDPLAKKFSRKKTTFVSKGTGVISPGTYSRGVVRRKGVLKKIIIRSPRGGPTRYIT